MSIGLNPTVQVFSYAERPDLADRADEVDDVFPEFLYHGDVTNQHWHRLREDLPELQLVLYDEERDALPAAATRSPREVADGLPGGVDDMLERHFGSGPRYEPDALSALLAVVDPAAGEG